MSDALPPLTERLRAVQLRIEGACARAGRERGGVRLLAVSKGQGAAAIAAAHALGQREFGENYAQELVRKAAALEGLADLRFRFIGRLQRNKVKLVLQTGCSVDSVDSLTLAQALSSEAGRLGREVECMLQVNIDREPQKAGVLPEGTHTLAAAVRALPGLRLVGLMAIPRAGDEPEQALSAFRALRALAARCELPELSMGMSSDLEPAIEAGATLVRVGTAIFGPRS